MLRTAAIRRAALGLRPRRRLPHRALSSIRTATRATNEISSAALAAAAPLTLAFAATTYARAEANHDAAIEAARIRAQRLADAAERAAQLRRTPSRWRLLRRAMNLSLRATPLVIGRITADAASMVGIRRIDDLWWSWCLREVERAGPTFIKLCQWAASRDDLFPVQATRRFARLHDRVEPHSYEQTQLSVSKAFGDQDLTIGPILGSGCVAQVHRGTLHGRDVAVKVVHPGVRELVDCDMCLLRGIGNMVEYWAPSLKYLAVRGTLQRFEKVMRAQLDLRTEAANLEKLHLLFSEDENVVIPRPVLDVIDGAQRDVLVEDFVEGTPVLKYAANKSIKEKELLATHGARTVLKMVLHHNFVHGDLHPGNVLVEESTGRLAILDAGICVEIPTETHKTMVRVLRAMLEYRGDDAARLLLENNGGSDDSHEQLQREEAFVDGFAKFVESTRTQPIFDSMASYVGDVCALAVNNRVALDASFVAVALAVKVVEGLVVDLQPDFPFVEIAVPMFLKESCMRASREEAGRMSAYMNGLLTGLRNEESQ